MVSVSNVNNVVGKTFKVGYKGRSFNLTRPFHTSSRHSVPILAKATSTKGVGGIYINKLSSITPIKRKARSLATILTMDIETISFNDVQIPILVSGAYYRPDHKDYRSIYSVISHRWINDSNVQARVNYLWKDFFSKLYNVVRSTGSKRITIFAHNGGRYDYLFLLKGMFNISGIDPSKTEVLMDKNNNIIFIKALSAFYWYGILVEFKDSFRFFNVSLNDLCSNMEVETKTCTYNEAWNTLDVFKPSVFKIFKD